MIAGSADTVFEVAASTASASACKNFGALGSVLGLCGSRVEVGLEVFGVAAFVRFISMVMKFLLVGAARRLNCAGPWLNR